MRYRIIYLTARRDLLLDKTRAWLDANLFPPGPVIGRRFSWTPPSAEDFKRAALARLRERFPELSVGIGDAASDAAAYLAAGMTAVLYRPRGRIPQGAHRCRSWREIATLCERL
jgi:hypothetical protein